MKVSVVMPAYMLSKHIMYSINIVDKVMKKHYNDYEIIVVDDGSHDDTYVYASKFSSYKHIKIFRLPKNMGKGFALLYGYRRSCGDIIVFFDGDLDIDPRQIILLVNMLKNNDVDIVITSKWHPDSKTIASPTRRFLSKSFYYMAKIFLGLNMNDTQTGAKAFKRYVLDEISKAMTIKRYAFDIELLVLASLKKYKIVEVPALWKIKLTSRFKIKEIIRMMIDLLAITYRYRIIKYYQKILNGQK